MIDVKLLTFIMVAKTKNFTKAAQALSLTQPAISQHIKSLESHYGTKLFYKRNRQMILTEEGEFLFTYALELDRLSKMITTKLKNHSNISKRYDVGATLTIGGYVLPQIIGRFKQNYENIEIMLHVENTEQVVKKLINGTINLGVVEGPFNREKMKYQKFKDDELVLATAPDHAFASRESVTMEEVLKEKLILRERGSGTRQIFENYLVKNGIALENMNIYMEIGNITALISLVESNLGCTVISKEAIKSHVKNHKLKIVPIEDYVMLREFNFIYLDDIHKAFIDKFMTFCQQSLE